MNRSALFIGLGGGVVSAILLLSAAQGSFGGRLLLFFLGPLPLFLSGLGWGVPSAAIAALTGAGAAAGMLGLWPGVIYLLTQGLPAILLTYLALMRRQAAVATAGADTGGTDAAWYPVGNLLTASALIAGGLAATSFAIVGWDIQELRKGLTEFITQVLQRQLTGFEAGKMTPQEIAALAEALVNRLPAAMALMWFLTLILNLWVAGKISAASGRLERPWPVLSQFRLPAGMALALAVSLAATFVPGLPGMLANAVSTACLAAYVLQGLAIIHHVTRGRSWRIGALAAMYVALVLTGSWGAYALALVGLAEPLSPLNRDAAPRNG